MDQSWQGNIFENSNVDLNQEQQGFGMNSSNVDLNSMIGDFIQHEQYPYNLNFNDSLTELSPEETEQFLEDAFSLSSKSPLSDDLTESSLSLQNSPADQGISDDYLCFPTFSNNVKQEELSPTYISEHQYDKKSRPNLMPVASPYTNSVSQAANDLPNILQQNLASPTQPQDVTVFLHKPEERPVSNVTSLTEVLDNSPTLKQDCQSVEQFPRGPESAARAKKGFSNQQPGSLVNLLQKVSSNEHDSNFKQQGSDMKKKSIRAKRQKTEVKKMPQEKNKNVNEIKSHQAELQGSMKLEHEQSTAQQTVSQVVMIPQVVFASGDGKNATSQPITAILATSTKQVMTTVPIKILSANTSEVEKIAINPIGKKVQEVSMKRKAEKVCRKTNHNEVEKRYRESITTSLEDLKELVFGSETKSTKAGILRKAMEHIRYLRKNNQRLKQENMRLKMAQKQTSLADLVQNHSSYHNLQQNNTIEDFSESLSEDEDMALIEEEIESNDADNSPASSVTSPIGVESLQGNGTFSLVNKQRFFLSMFMFAFMFLGPGKMLFGEKNAPGGDYMTPHTGGRTILSHAADPEEDGFRVYTGMIVNCVLYLLFFAWLLIKGEPRYSDGSKNVASYKMYMKNADADMARGDIQSATINIERGLNVIGRPWSSSLLDIVPSLIWHGWCHVLHQLGLLSLLKNFGWMLLPRRLSLADAKARYRASCAMAAQAYSRLLQVASLDTARPKRKLVYLKLLVAAVNMAENAENAMSCEDALTVYLNAAVLLRVKFGVFAKFFMYYLVNRSKSELNSRAECVPGSLAWVFHPVGCDYLHYGSWSVNLSKQHKVPLRQIRRSFFMTQIKAILRHLVAPTNANIDILESENQLSLLKQCCFRDDAVFVWWHDLLATVFYIGVGMHNKATDTWEAINETPDIETPYASDLYDLVDCYFDAKDEAERTELEARLSMVEDNIIKNFIFEEGKTERNDLSRLLAVTCADMALNVRIADWEASSSKSLSTDQLEKFERDLSVLKDFDARNKLLQGKIQYFEEVLMVMAGVNPISLKRDLLRRRQQQQDFHSNDSDGKLKIKELQETKALIFVLKHLPSIVTNFYPKNCVTKLQKAGQVLENSGLREMTEDCKRILATLKAM